MGNIFKKQSSWLLLFFVGISLLQLGTIRRKEDPVTKTQADPILYKEKMEQEKDGKKEAPMPSFTLYGKQKFLADSPVADAPREDARLAEDTAPWESESGTAQEGLLDDPDAWQPASADEEGLHEKSSETPSAFETSEEEEDWWSEEDPPK